MGSDCPDGVRPILTDLVRNTLGLADVLWFLTQGAPASTVDNTAIQAVGDLVARNRRALGALLDQLTGGGPGGA